MSATLPKLYHLISDLESARVRRFIQDKNLSEQIQYANIGVGDRDRTELETALPGAKVPVLKTPGGEWLQGSESIIQFLNLIAK